MEFIPILILVAVLIISRVFGEKSSKGLTDDQKEAITVELIKVRKIFIMPILVFFATYALCLFSLHLQPTEVNRIYMPVLAVLLTAIYYISYVKLKALNLGEVFNRNYLISKVVILAGVYSFMVIMFLLKQNQFAV